MVRMSGLSSTTSSRARPTSGTDVLVCPPGSLLRASRSSGSARRTQWVCCTTGTGSPVPVRMTSLLFLLADGLRGEGLGIPSPLHGCHLWQDDVLVCCSYGGESGYIYSDILKNSCGIVSLLLVFAGYDALRAVFPSFVHVCGVSTGAVLDQVLCPSLLRMVPMARQRTTV